MSNTKDKPKNSGLNGGLVLDGDRRPAARTTLGRIDPVTYE
jgi:hypothetical protein